MYVCSTKKSDVRNALKDMVKNHKDLKTYAPPHILQVGMKNYKHLKNGGSPSVLAKKEAKYLINLSSLTVHKKDCKHAGKNTIKAILINVKNTGLRICRHCQ